ncbi:MAG TPA: hypothetical protein VM939_00615 [Gemmatimonadaceae bacterium]|nr:hypothetical protein [Gemmatimonadaceae bacterium]
MTINAQVRFSAAVVFALASSVAVAQQRPPVRPVGAVIARSAEPLANVGTVRGLSTGGVLVNDIAGRRVVLFDKDLKNFIVVADTTAATGNAYAGRMGGLITYRGDSSLFVDPQSLSMMVIDPSGKIGRVMSVPRSEDAMMIAGGFGGASYDGKGGLIYRSSPRFNFRGGARPGTPGFVPPEPPDSAAIVRIDLATRELDTLTFIKTMKIKMDVTRDANGGMSMVSQINPLPIVDDWTVLPDGSLAVVRGRDYRMDLVNTDGSKTALQKIPFDWQRLTDEDKIAFIDSLKAARARLGPNAPGVQLGGPGGAGPGAGAAGGQPMMQMRIESGPAAGREPGATRTMTGGTPSQMNFVPPTELPDYKPAFFAGSVRADMEGNVWIRTIPTSAISGGAVFDVVNRKGELVERVQIPSSRAIAGFGPGGTVYMTVRENDKTYLEVAKIR